jgi:hypothetical protein
MAAFSWLNSAQKVQCPLFIDASPGTLIGLRSRVPLGTAFANTVPNGKPEEIQEFLAEAYEFFNAVQEQVS